MTEAQLQSKCVVEFSQAYPDLRGRLFATFQNTINASQGSHMLSMGLVRGVSDLIYIDDQKYIIGIEMKAPGTKHKASHVLEQCDWLETCCYKGYFCTSVEMFWDIVNGGEGLTVNVVRKMAENKKTVLF